MEPVRTIADLARARGYAALMSPSAALENAVNLSIYIDGRAADLKLDVGGVREPLVF